ncbi:MAG: DUF4326 domain-containing protein [Nitrososphaeraceae archaeon]
MMCILAGLHKAYVEIFPAAMEDGAIPSENKELMNQLPELKGKVLGCWCAPLPCHGDTLAELANK